MRACVRSFTVLRACFSSNVGWCPSQASTTAIGQIAFMKQSTRSRATTAHHIVIHLRVHMDAVEHNVPSGRRPVEQLEGNLATTAPYLFFVFCSN